jgi:AraC-like DNA-binding protein
MGLSTGADPCGFDTADGSISRDIERDPIGRFELSRFARATNVTRFQVIRDFEQVTGFTPAAFVRDRRVRLASRLIEGGEMLANAALSAGSADQSHFSRAFKLSHGSTSTILRQAVRGLNVVR